MIIAPRAGVIRAATLWYAVALGSDKRPVDSLTSNIGHCLWSGIVSDERAPLVAARLMSPEMWNGWGIRTLAADEPAYDPMPEAYVTWDYCRGYADASMNEAMHGDGFDS